MNVQLGGQQSYPENYDPSLLVSIARSASRSSLKCKQFNGVDLWTCYELSWLDSSGKPFVAIAEVRVPADSPNIIESKSFKYYLNSLNQHRVGGQESLKRLVSQDLSAVAGALVDVRLYSLEGFVRHRAQTESLGWCLDDLELGEALSRPDKSLLLSSDDQQTLDDSGGVWCSHLLKSNCPVTGQPDWASIWLGMKGVKPCPQSLLRYIVSFRNHQDFHESCVERIYSDLSEVFEPSQLWVYARYTRRGGLDINPFRSSESILAPVVFGARQ